MNDVRELFHHRVSAVWAGLVLATAISFALGTEHGIDDRTLAMSIALVIAFVKVHLVGSHFMELRDAPLPLRLLFSAWCLIVGVGTVVLYAAGGQRLSGA